MNEQQIAQLDALAKWMRSVGATRARVGDAELELGHAPAGPQREPEELTDEQVIALAKKDKDDFERLLFASSEGFHHPIVAPAED